MQSMHRTSSCDAALGRTPLPHGWSNASAPTYDPSTTRIRSGVSEMIQFLPNTFISAMPIADAILAVVVVVRSGAA